jgi:hypothetical protein
MKLEGDYLFEATVAEVWSALFDPVILAAVMPGCEKLDLVDGQYVGEIKVKVGPIQGKFTGKVDLKDKVEPQSYTMVVDGRGAPGFVKATAAVKLAADGECTRVSYDTDAQVGGKIASVGQRLLEASARAIVAQSLEGLHANIKLRAAVHREAAAKRAAAAPEPTPASAAPEVEAASNGTEVAINGIAATSNGAEAVSKLTEATGKLTEATGKLTEATGKTAEVTGKTAEVTGKTAEVTGKTAEVTGEAVEATEVVGKATEAVGKATEATEATGKATEAVGKATEAASQGTEATTKGIPAGPSTDAEKAADVIAFTPIKIKQSALANAVAKEVASSLFPRSVLVGIILIQAAVIVWLLLRH